MAHYTNTLCLFLFHLQALLEEDPKTCPIAKIVDGLRVAKAVGVDVSAALQTLSERVSRELHKAVNPIDPDEENDSTLLTDTIRDATLVNGCGASVDTGRLTFIHSPDVVLYFCSVGLCRVACCKR